MSCLHFVIERTLIMPCYEATDQIIDHNNLGDITMVNDERRCLCSFMEINLEEYYKVLKPKLHMVKILIKESDEKHDIKIILANQQEGDNFFFQKCDGNCSITILQERYVYAMALMAKLYGEKYLRHFKYAQVLIEYIVVTTSSFSIGLLFYVII